MASIIIIILVSATVILSVYSLFFIKMPRSYKIISLSSLIISIVALCCSSFRMTFQINDSAAFIAIIAGVIVLPTTIVIGWNIYQLIDVRNLRNELVEAKINKEELRNEIEKKGDAIWNSYIIDQIAFTQLVRAYNNKVESPERLFSIALTFLNNKAFERKSLTSILGFEYAHQLLCTLSEDFTSPDEYIAFAEKVKGEGLKKEALEFFLSEYNSQLRNEKVDAILRQLNAIIK